MSTRLLALLLLFTGARVSASGSCWVNGFPDRLKWSRAVFEGVVTREFEVAGQSVCVVQVSRVFRGEVPPTVLVRSRRYRFKLPGTGEPWIFAFLPDGEGEGPFAYIMDKCDASSPTASLTESDWALLGTGGPPRRRFGLALGLVLGPLALFATWRLRRKPAESKD